MNFVYKSDEIKIYLYLQVRIEITFRNNLT
jgi:hypothetical protein